MFLTNYLPPVRRKLGIDTDDLRARNPRHHRRPGLGRRPRRAPRPRRAATTAPSFWARGGVGAAMPELAGGWPPGQPTPAFGDVMGGLATAGAIAAALLKRERTGEASVVDVSLLATAMWQVSPMVIASKLFGFSKIPQGDRTKSFNPGVGTYRTADDRFIALILLQSDKHWDDFVERLGVPDMADDPRFADAAARAENADGVHRPARRGVRQPAAGPLEGGARRPSRACGARSRRSTSSTTTCRCRPTATCRR